LLIVIPDSDSWQDETWKGVDFTEIGHRVRVKLVRTGVTKGFHVSLNLSEVSSTVVEEGGFQVVTTSLNIALRFVASLQDQQLTFERAYKSASQVSNPANEREYYWGPDNLTPPEEMLRKYGYDYTGPKSRLNSYS